jgi:hypothetical protein
MNIYLLSPQHMQSIPRKVCQTAGCCYKSNFELENVSICAPLVLIITLRVFECRYTQHGISRYAPLPTTPLPNSHLSRLSDAHICAYRTAGGGGEVALNSNRYGLRYLTLLDPNCPFLPCCNTTTWTNLRNSVTQMSADVSVLRYYLTHNWLAMLYKHRLKLNGYSYVMVLPDP